jgi:hypothetical protein
LFTFLDAPKMSVNDSTDLFLRELHAVVISEWLIASRPHFEQVAVDPET